MSWFEKARRFWRINEQPFEAVTVGPKPAMRQSPTKSYDEAGLTTDQIKTATENFKALHAIALRAVFRPTLSQEQIAALLEQVRRLPKTADYNVETPMPREWKQRQNHRLSNHPVG